MSNNDNAHADTNSNVNAVARDKSEISRNEEIVNQSDLWNHRLEENRIARRKESKFFSLEAGETADVEVIEIVGPVGKDFDHDDKPDTIQYEYKVQDLNDLNGGIRIWDLSKSWSEALDFQLSQGNRAIRASRKGSGMQTKYYFSAINVQRSK
jgi:hypothetical protein